MRQPDAITTVGITGASGLIGSALASLLGQTGYRVVCIPRQRDTYSLAASLDAVVHLAGEPIASGRWTAEKKERIRDSRVQGTLALCQALAQSDHPPRTIVCASAVGFYGNRGDELLDEQSQPGHGFLAEVVQAWEESTRPATQRGLRVVSLRFGMILSRQGGALAKMLPPFRCGLGGRIGDGRQYWSWIALDDALAAVCHALTSDSLAGPVNVVAPRPVTNAEFTAALGRALRRPTCAAVPAWVVRTVFGQMADELLLASTRVVPRRLLETGFTFRYDRLDSALEHLLGRESNSVAGTY